MRLLSKDNEKIQNRQGRYFLSKKFKDFEKAVQLITKTQYKEKPLEGDLEVTLTAYFTNKVHADMFNLPKGLMDALQGFAFINDRQIKTGSIIVLEGYKSDGFVVSIKKMDTNPYPIDNNG